MAGEEGQRRNWKKLALGLFVVAAAAGLVLGLIAAFKPEVYGNKSKSSSESTTTQGYQGDVSKGGINSPIDSAINQPVPVVNPNTGDLDTTPTPPEENKGDLANLDASAACKPADGPALILALTSPTCTVITLLPGVRYKMGAAETVITSPKVVIGNPLVLPILDGSGAPRLFRVRPGGFLDLKYVITWRGGGELLTPLKLPVLRGGAVFVELGGKFTAFGVIFTNAPPSELVVLIAPDLSRAVRVFGGQIYVAGGTLTLTLCHFWVLQPGVLLREIYVVGADLLVASGVAILSGVTFTNSQLFLNGFGAGFQLAHLAGVLVCSGVTFVINFGAINASGAGILSFVGAGVAIFQGVVWNANLGLLAHFGSGIGLFNGAGVVVISGGAFNFNVGAGIEAGTAIFVSQGAGSITMAGVAQAVNVGANFFAGAGLNNFQGAGSFVAVGLAMTRNVGALSAYGIGGSAAVGAGDLVVIAAPSSDDYGVASIVLMGGDWFLGAGILVEIACQFSKNIGALFGIFQGINAFVGAGGLVVKDSPGTVDLGIAWTNPNATIYFVQGQHVNPPANITKFKIMGDDPVKPIDRERKLGQGLNMPSFFTVLQGKNTINDGAASSTVQAIRDSPISMGDMLLNADFAHLPEGTECNACGLVGDLASEITGAGSKTCSAQGSCNLNDAEVFNTDGVKQILPEWILNLASLYDPATKDAKMPNTAIVTNIMRVGCNSATNKDLSSCANVNDVKALIEKNLGTTCARVNLADRDGFKKVAELGDDMPASEGLEFDTSKHTDVFDLSFIGTGNDCAKAVQDWVAAFKSEDLLSQLKEIAPVDVNINNVGISALSQHNVNGNDLTSTDADIGQAAASTVSNSLTPSVIVSAPGSNLATPVLTQGGAANLMLVGFTPGSPVNLVITDKCTPLAQEGTDLGSTAYTNANGQTIQVTVPANMADGSYSFKATQKGIGWCSQPVTVKGAK